MHSKLLSLLISAVLLASCAAHRDPPKFIPIPGCVLGEQTIGPYGEPNTCWQLNPDWVDIYGMPTPIQISAP